MNEQTARTCGEITANLIVAICIGLIIGFAIVYWKYATIILVGGIILVAVGSYFAKKGDGDVDHK
jgi:hypothetical protein